MSITLFLILKRAARKNIKSKGEKHDERRKKRLGSDIK